jgi:hypothetical protein
MTVIMAYAPQVWQLSDIHCDAPRLVRGQPGQVEELLAHLIQPVWNLS